VETLRKTSLEDVVKFFNSYVHPDSLTRRKLSVHMRSQSVPTAPSAKFSVEASEAFLPLLKSHDIPVEEAQYRELSKAEPPVETVRAFWTTSLAQTPGLENADKEKLLNAIEALSRAHPPKGGEPVDAGKAELRKDAVVIEDIASFKASLPLGPAAVPVHRAFHARL
jgi:insulysin